MQGLIKWLSWTRLYLLLVLRGVLGWIGQANARAIPVKLIKAAHRLAAYAIQFIALTLAGCRPA